MHQSDLITLGDPAARDRGRYRVLPGFGGTALFDADFHNFSFAPHFHDTLMLGLILEGEKQFIRGRTPHRVARGGISVVNPGDMHTGGVAGADRRLRYAAAYPGAALLGEAGLPEGADFHAAVVQDDDLRPVFAHALSAATPAPEAEEALLIALAGLAARYGSARRNAGAVSCSRALARAVDYIEASLETPLTIAEMAATAGIGPRHLIRCFRRELGITPLQYVRQARVREAARLLRLGETVGQAAMATGFADQAHMTRTFRAIMGITPAAFARSWRAALQA